MLSAEPRQQEEERPLFWQHMQSELNEAHQALDQLGAPKTKMVPKRSGEGTQDITIGLRERLLSLPKPIREATSK